MAEKIIKVPDIGGATGVDVIEILVKPGDKIDIDFPLVTLESDKASMEIPSPIAGVVRSIKVKIGDKIAEGHELLMVETEAEDTVKPDTKVEKSATPPKDEKVEAVSQVKAPAAPLVDESVQSQPKEAVSAAAEAPSTSMVSAGPAVRRLAREFGIDLALVSGTGRKSRISKEDVALYVKNRLSGSQTGNGLALPAAPSIDFSKFGTIEVKPLSKIKRLTGANVHRAWITIPHVTQFDEADITELEAFRKAETEHAKAHGFKLTILAFVCKVVCKALAVFPQFNASLDATGDNLIFKHYFNLGVAVETPNGLVVPVIKDVDRLSVSDIAKEMARLSTKAREKGLMPTDMNGGCFTISSLGGIGGTAFTPIVNSPEVAILGLSRSKIQPVYIDGEFKPRLMLPLSLSYDHRVVDGAEAARFTRFVSEGLADLRKILL